MKLDVDVMLQMLSSCLSKYFTCICMHWETQLSEIIIQFIFSNNEGESWISIKSRIGLCIYALCLGVQRITVSSLWQHCLDMKVINFQHIAIK